MADPPRLFDGLRPPDAWTPVQGAGWRVERAQGLGAIQLKCRIPPAAAMEAAAVVLGAQLPSAGAVAAGLAGEILWEGPAAWLVLTRQDDAARLLDRLSACFQGVTASLIDASDRLIALTLTGPRRGELIRRGTAFPVRQLHDGQSVRVRFANLSVQLTASTARDGLLLTTDAVHAPYLRDWFLHAEAASGQDTTFKA